MLIAHHSSNSANILVAVSAAVGVALLGLWYWREARQLRRRFRRARRIRAWRARMTAMADQPFHLKLLTSAERSRLIGRGGLNSEQWARTWAADFIAGRREGQPTCGDYLAEFGTRPTVRPAETRTPVRN